MFKMEIVEISLQVHFRLFLAQGELFLEPRIPVGHGDEPYRHKQEELDRASNECAHRSFQISLIFIGVKRIHFFIPQAPFFPAA